MLRTILFSDLTRYRNYRTVKLALKIMRGAIFYALCILSFIYKVNVISWIEMLS